MPINAMIAVFEYIMATNCIGNNRNNRDGILVEQTRLFCLLSIDVLENLSSISPLESTFNGVQIIHTTHRNRLGKVKLGKLIKIWFNRRRLRLNGLL